MNQIPYHYLKSIMITLFLIGTFSMSLPSDARAACAVYTNGHEKPGPKYPDHPNRYGSYFYVGDDKEEVFAGGVKCGVNDAHRNYKDSKLEKLQKQIDNAYAKFAGCEANGDIGNCQKNTSSPNTWEGTLRTSLTSLCGEGYEENVKYGRFYYCAGGGMMERTDFIPVIGCAPNTYAATDNCQPCPKGKYSPKGSITKSQCVDKGANEAVWAISKANDNGFFSCPKGSNFEGDGNCSCKKGTKWKSKENQCE